MSRFLCKWMVGYGLFLMIIGIFGFLSNPEKAKTALLSGGGFGFLSIVLGTAGSVGLVARPLP